MRLDDSVRDSQAQPGTNHTGGEEWLHRPLRGFARKARAIILQVQVEFPQARIPSLDTEANYNPRIARVRLQRVDHDLR